MCGASSEVSFGLELPSALDMSHLICYRVAASVNAPDNFEDLFKGSFDNVSEYLERKRERLASQASTKLETPSNKRNKFSGTMA